MITEDLKRLRKALDESFQMLDNIEIELGGKSKLRSELETASSLVDDLIYDTKKIEQDIHTINRML